MIVSKCPGSPFVKRIFNEAPAVRPGTKDRKLVRLQVDIYVLEESNNVRQLHDMGNMEGHSPRLPAGEHA